MPKDPYRKLEVREDADRRYVEKPSEAVLAKAEAELAFLLPESYRQFVLRFGAGELAGRYRIFAPLLKPYKDRGIPVYDLTAEHARVASFLADYEVADQETNFRLFATDSGGVMYLMNVAEVTKVRTHEYAVYQAIHQDEVYRVADTFAEFVEKGCSGQISSSNPPEEMRADWSFERFLSPSKK